MLLIFPLSIRIKLSSLRLVVCHCPAIIACFKKIVFLLLVVCGVAMAQGEPAVAVYVTGAKDESTNRVFGNKLLEALAKSEKYARIDDHRAFYEEMAKSKNIDNGQISKIAKRYGAVFVCVVNMDEIFNEYSISAEIIKTDNSKVIKSASIDSKLNSSENLSKAANELANSFKKSPSSAPSSLPVPHPQAAAPAQAPVATQAQAPVADADDEETCDRKIEIGDIISQIKDAFPQQMKNCGIEFGKNQAMARLPFKKVSPESLDPKQFFPKCIIDGIKKENPALNKLATDIEDFVQSLLKAAQSANGQVDPQKILEKASDIKTLLDNIQTNYSNGVCAPPAENLQYTEKELEEASAASSQREAKTQTTPKTGIRLGLNLSNVDATIDFGEIETSGIGGVHVGMAMDKRISGNFYFATGVALSMKGYDFSYDYEQLSLHMEGTEKYYFLQVPIMLSFKIPLNESSAIRADAGVYGAYCLKQTAEISINKNGIYSDEYMEDQFSGLDFGLSFGGGIEFLNFYVGVVYEKGMTNNGGGVGEFSINNFGLTLGYNF